MCRKQGQHIPMSNAAEDCNLQAVNAGCFRDWRVLPAYASCLGD
jgi:hypothetical protein